ncbi:MAG: glutathione S-transferase family protein [Thalassovita sp.]
MKLHWSPRSPYVRKVMIAAQELGVADQIETVRTQVDFVSYAEALSPDNPLGKLPTLVLEDGRSLFDSRVICEYLDAIAGQGRLFPQAVHVRFEALRDLALGDGLVDALMMRLIERVKPEPRQSPDILHANHRKCQAVYDHLNAQASTLAKRPFHIGHIAIGVALGYADFRFADDDWRNGRPALSDWHDGFMARPSVLATPVIDDSENTQLSSEGAHAT